MSISPPGIDDFVDQDIEYLHEEADRLLLIERWRTKFNEGSRAEYENECQVLREKYADLHPVKLVNIDSPRKLLIYLTERRAEVLTDVGGNDRKWQEPSIISVEEMRGLHDLARGLGLEHNEFVEASLTLGDELAYISSIRLALHQAYPIVGQAPPKIEGAPAPDNVSQLLENLERLTSSESSWQKAEWSADRGNHRARKAAEKALPGIEQHVLKTLPGKRKLTARNPAKRIKQAHEAADAHRPIHQAAVKKEYDRIFAQREAEATPWRKLADRHKQDLVALRASVGDLLKLVINTVGDDPAHDLCALQANLQNLYVNPPVFNEEGVIQSTGYFADPELVTKAKNYLAMLWRKSQKPDAAAGALSAMDREPAAPVVSRPSKNALFHSGHDESLGEWSSNVTLTELMKACDFGSVEITKLILRRTGLIQKSRQNWIANTGDLKPEWAEAIQKMCAKRKTSPKI